jgi:DNA-binding response OmpR family regulator
MVATIATTRRVLVVEDDADTRDLVTRLIRRSGCQVRAAESVREALGHLHDELPTHIVLDLMMPDIDGVVLLRAVRRHNLPVRVAVLTAAGPDSPAVAEALQWQPDALSYKPATFTDVEAWLGDELTARPKHSGRSVRKRVVLVDIDLIAVAAHLSEEEGRPIGEAEVRQWLLDAGFQVVQDGRWVVNEADLGQLDPSEVRSLEDACEE